MLKFYVGNKKNEWREVPKALAMKSKIFAVEQNEGGHIYMYKNTKSQSGVSMRKCLACGCKDGVFTSSCSGEHFDDVVLSRIKEKDLDYVYGSWLTGITPIMEVENLEQLNRNYEIIKVAFEEDFKNDTDLAKKIQSDYESDVKYFTKEEEGLDG